jgi:hypothetical protein
MRSPVFVKLLILSAVLGGCASDGGSSGTGLTSVTGNVVSAQTASLSSPRPVTWFARLRALLAVGGTAIAQDPVEGIRVSIEGTNIAGSTDANGLFLLDGDFAGPIGMRFERADDALSARLVIVVPNGGALTLSNVRIDGGQVVVDSQRVTFDGVVLSTDCPVNLAEMASRQRPNDGHIYRVHLTGASVQDAAGAPLACSALEGSRFVRVDATVRSDEDFDAQEVEIDDDRSGGGNNAGSGGGGDDDGNNFGSAGGDDDGGNNSGAGGGDDDGGDNSGPGGGHDDSPDDNSGPG